MLHANLQVVPENNTYVHHSSSFAVSNSDVSGLLAVTDSHEHHLGLQHTASLLPKRSVVPLCSLLQLTPAPTVVPPARQFQSKIAVSGFRLLLYRCRRQSTPCGLARHSVITIPCC